MRCAFDPQGARLAGVHLFRVRRQEIADENPRCPADPPGLPRGERTHGCGDGTELAESGLKVPPLQRSAGGETKKGVV
jgi:hypothetical protein